MFLVWSYDQIEKRERNVENQELVIFLFVRPGHPLFDSIIRDFEYLHFNSGEYCSIYAIGYSTEIDSIKKNERGICKAGNGFFSAKDFQEFKTNLEERIRWNYSGETEVLILQNNPGQPNSLNFQNYVAVSIDEGLRKGYIDSFQIFMESLIRSSRTEVNARRAIQRVARSRIKIKDLIADAISDCKRIPAPIKTITKNRLFYRTAVSFKRR